MEHEHEFYDFNIVSTFTIQFEKVMACDCGMFKVKSRKTHEWELMQP
jgi:hypothetical protein